MCGNVDSPKGACDAEGAGEFLRAVTTDANNGQSDPANEQKKADATSLVIEPTVVPGSQLNLPNSGREEKVDYNLVNLDSKGQTSAPDADHSVTLTETLVVPDKNKKANPGICSPGCTSSTPNSLRDTDSISPSAKGHTVEKRFTIDQGTPVRIYDSATKKTYDYVRVAASMKKGFVFTYGNDH